MEETKVIEQGEFSAEALEQDLVNVYEPSEDLITEDYCPEFEDEDIIEQSLAFKEIRAKKSVA